MPLDKLDWNAPGWERISENGVARWQNPTLDQRIADEKKESQQHRATEQRTLEHRVQHLEGAEPQVLKILKAMWDHIEAMGDKNVQRNSRIEALEAKSAELERRNVELTSLNVGLQTAVQNLTGQVSSQRNHLSRLQSAADKQTKGKP